MNPQMAYAYNWLLQKGYAPNAAAGIVGNLAQESNFGNGVGDNGTAFGWGQWRGDRAAGFRNYAAANRLDISSPEANLGWLHQELQSQYQPLVGQLNAAKSPDEAAGLFGLRYERPKGAETGVAANIDGYTNRVAQARLAAGLPAGSSPLAGQFAAAGPLQPPAAAPMLPQPGLADLFAMPQIQQKQAANQSEIQKRRQALFAAPSPFDQA